MGEFSELMILRARVDELERKLDLVLHRLGLQTGEASAADQSDIIELLRQGQKIEAIKLYRERTGLGLKEAKDAVEAIERQRR